MKGFKKKIQTPKNADTLGKRIYWIRRILGETREEFAQRLGVSARSIVRWEQGDNAPSGKTLIKIADVGKCSVDWISNGQGKGPVEPWNEMFALMNAKTFEERMKQLRENILRLSKFELAGKLGVTEETIEKYEEGKLKPNYDILMKFSDLANVSIDFLTKGEIGEKEKGFVPHDRFSKLEQEVDSLKKFLEEEAGFRRAPGKEETVTVDLKLLTPKIPVIASVPAGKPVEITKDMIIDWIWMPDDVILKKNKEIFGVLIDGDSMSPRLMRGDYAIVIPQDTANNHDIIVARLNGEGVIKEYVKKENNIILKSCNSEYSPILVTPQDDFEIIGMIYGIGFRKLK